MKKNNIVEELKGVLSIEEVENNLADSDYTQALFANNVENRTDLESEPDRVNYSCVIKQSVYEDIVNNDNCGPHVIDLIKSANGELHLGKLTFKDLEIEVVANYPSLSDGVDVSISFKVKYKRTNVADITPALLPADSTGLVEFTEGLVLMLNDAVERCEYLNDKFIVPQTLEQFRNSKFYSSKKISRLDESYNDACYDEETFLFNQNKTRHYVSYADIGLRLIVSVNEKDLTGRIRLICGDFRYGYFKEFEKIDLPSPIVKSEVDTLVENMLLKVRDNLDFYKEEQFQILKNYKASYFETVR